MTVQIDAAKKPKKNSILKSKREYARLATNLATASVRHDTLEGRDCYVVPVAMIQEGVWEGSNGPILYTKDELKSCVAGYNGKPTVVYHPEENGVPVSACDPDVLNTYGVGRVFRHQVDNKLRSLAYLDKERVATVDPRVEEALQEGKPVEVSTGFYMDVEMKKGTWNGKPYVGIAHNLQPDHLAILPDKLGAYSVKDGGGMLVANREFTDQKRKKLAKKGQALPDGSFPIVTKQDLENAIKAVGRASNQAAAKRHIIKRARAMGMMNMLPKEWVTNGSQYLLEVNEMSFNEISCDVREALAAKMGQPGKPWYGYIVDIYPDSQTVVFCQDGDEPGMYWQVGYTVENDEVALTGEPVQVERQVQYVTANLGGTPPNKETTMAFDKTKHVASLIGNGFEESQRDELMKLPDQILERITPKVTTQTPTTNAGGPATTIVVQPADTSEFQKALKTVQDQIGGVSLKQLIDNTATPAQKAQFDAIDQTYQSQKAQAIEIITNAKGNRFTKDFLQTKELPELSGMAEICIQASGKQQPGGVQMFQPNFSGAAGSAPTNNAAHEMPTEVLLPPSIDFAAK